MKFPIVSPKTMRQADAVVILGSGPSLDKTKEGIQSWHSQRSAIVFGAHYRYFLESQYTVFDTPRKFVNAQGNVAGKYLVGERIDRTHIKKK